MMNFAPHARYGMHRLVRVVAAAVAGCLTTLGPPVRDEPADNGPVRVPESLRRDTDFEGIQLMSVGGDDAREELAKYAVWADVPDDVPKSVVIEIDRIVYLPDIGHVQIANRDTLFRYARGYTCTPAGIRRDGDGFLVTMHVVVNTPFEDKVEVTPHPHVIEEWRYAPTEGTLTFVRTVKALRPLCTASLE